MTPITERSENLICVAPLQQSILSVAFVQKLGLDSYRTSVRLGHTIRFTFSILILEALCMARTLPLHSLCIVLTATALTATGMSQSAPGHPGLRRVQQANSGSDNGLDYTTSWIGNTFGGNTTGPRHGYAPRSGGRARHLCHSR